MPPKVNMAKAATTTRLSAPAMKRKTRDESEENLHANTKKRRQNIALKSSKPGDSDDEDAGFTFTRATKTQKPLTAPTRSSPRNHSKTASTSVASATPRAAKLPAEPVSNRQANDSDSFVALPVSDTPIIRKNQQLRQHGADGRRRSSLSMRGKRASSIGNGFQSLPHPDIPASEFYKHISEDLPEPVRMKQLLAWCARRCIDDSKSRHTLHGTETDEQIQAANIARTIEEEVLKDLIDNKVTTSWYHQPDQPLNTLEKKPHPQNVNNLKKMKEMEERIARLKAEEETWNTLLTEHTRSIIAPDKSTTTDATHESQPKERFAKISSQEIDLDLLPAEEAALIHALSKTEASQADRGQTNEDWLKEVAGGLEFQVDTLLQALHQQQQYLKQASGTSSKLLEGAAKAMTSAERIRSEASDAIGLSTIDVLRRITRIT